VGKKYITRLLSRRFLNNKGIKKASGSLASNGRVGVPMKRAPFSTDLACSVFYEEMCSVSSYLVGGLAGMV